jgi:hypothetical protein
MNSLPLPIDTLAAFLLGALIGSVICGLYCSRRQDRMVSDGEPGYTRRAS